MPANLTTRSPEQTESVGRRLAELLPPATVVGLVGPLGCGKTCFVRGMAAGLGIDPDQIASPTFVYLVDYQSGRLPLVHADLYRLHDLEGKAAETAFESIGLYDAIGSAGVVVVEWWDAYTGPAPRTLALVEFVIENVDVRSITLTFSGAGLAPVARDFADAGPR